MLESSMRKIVVQAIKPLDPISVENSVRPGTPDINYIGGWIELKVLNKWPQGAATKVRVPCFTPQQRVWLRRRVQRGGSAYLLIRIGTDWLLFDGATAAQWVGCLDKLGMVNAALLYCPGKLDTRALLKILKNA